MRWAVVSVVLVVLILVVYMGMTVDNLLIAERSDVIKSKDNVRTMITLMLARRWSDDPWPALGGRNSILSAVVRGQLDHRNPQNLEVLFPPSMDEDLSRLDRSEYAKLTKELLATQRFPHLTGYAGPGERPSDLRGPVPLIGDLTYDDGAIIGYSDGSVRWLDREELGLAVDDPIRCGPQSKSPILRMLSDE